MKFNKSYFSVSILILLSYAHPGIAQNKTAQSNSIKNLVMEGGGIRGIAYVGALMELQNRNMLDSITRVAGTSAGAIAATLFALSYTPEEISKSIYDLKIKSMADGKGIFIGGSIRLVRHFGWYKGDEFKNWISKLILEKTGKENLTFEELYNLSKKNPSYKDLFLTGTDLTQQKMVIFCKDTYPNMEVRTAVRISMGIPLYYQAVVLDKDGTIIHKKKEYHKGSVMVDGGILGNFPIHVFDYEKYLKPGGDSAFAVNYQTLGLRLDSDQQIKNDKNSLGLARVEVKNFKSYVAAFYNLTVENLNRQNLTAEDWKRTVSISTVGIGPKVKKMSVEEKNLLIDSGRKGVVEYFGGK
jgi:NTE family protein